MNKKALSAFLAMSSMAGVMAPSMTAFAAEENKNTVEDLITYAKNAKDLYHYNQAYAAIMADKDNANFNTWLGELAPVAKEIKGYDEMMKIIAEIQDEVQKNQSIEQYNAVVAKVQSLFDNGSICKTDKEYLDAELVYWTRTPIFTTQSDLTKVIDKTNEAAKLLADGKAREAQTAIEAAQAILADKNNNINEANEAYLTSNTVAPVAKNIEEAVAKLPVQVVSAEIINPVEIKVTFDQPVDEDTAKDLTNYSFGTTIGNPTDLIANNGNIANDDSVKFNADDTSVIFRLNKVINNGTKYTINVSNGIYSKDKTKNLEMYKGTETMFNDNTDPQLVSSEVDGNGLLKLKFNEPINSIGAITIDGIIVSNGIPAAGNMITSSKAGNYTVEVPYDAKLTDGYKNGVLANKLTSIGTHNVQAMEVKDIAAPTKNQSNVLNSQYTITDKSQVPSVEGLENVESTVNNADRTFDVIFSKKVNLNSVANNLTIKKGTIEFSVGKKADVVGENGAPTYYVEALDNNDQVIGTYDPTNVANTKDISADKIRVIFNADPADAKYNLYGDDENSETLSVKVEKYQTNDGYVGTLYEGNITISKDFSAPSLKIAECKLVTNTTIQDPNNKELKAGQTGIKLVFDKEVRNLDATKISVVDNNGINKTINLKNAYIHSVNKDTVYLAIADLNVNDAPYTVTVNADAVDNSNIINSNVGNKEQTIVLNSENNVQPTTVLAQGNVKATNTIINGQVVNQINISYKDSLNNPIEMGDSALNLGNYTLDGKALPAGTTITSDKNKENITITLPSNLYQNQTKQSFTISTNVQTKNGSMIIGSTGNNDAFNTILTMADNTKPVIESAKYLVTNIQTSDKSNRIQVTFNEDMGVVPTEPDQLKDWEDDLDVYIGSNKYDVTSISAGDNANELNITFGNSPIQISDNATIKVVPRSKDNSDGMTIADKAGNTIADKVATINVSGKILDKQLIAENAANQAAVNAVANGIEIKNPIADAKQLDMPKDVEGYKIEMVSSDPSVITNEGVITPPAKATEVTLTFTVTNKDGQTATKEVKVNVPQSAAVAEKEAKEANQKSVDDAAKNEVKNIELPKGSKLTEDKKTDVENAIKAKLTDKDITVKAEKVDDNNYKVTLTKGAGKTEGTTTIAKVPVSVAS